MKKFSFAMLVLGISLFGLMRFQLVADEPEKATDSVTSAGSGYRVRLSPQGSPPLKLDFGIGVNSDAGVIGEIVLNDDNFSAAASSRKIKAYAATKSGLLRVEDNESADIVIRTIGGNKYFVSQYVSPRKEASSVPTFPGHEAVIDLSYIFKNLDEFDRERQKMIKLIASNKKEFNHLRDDLKALQERLRKLRQEKDSENEMIVEILEKESLRKKVVLDEIQKASQQIFLRKEAEMYQKIYNKVTAEVAKYAKERGIKIVRRIDRTAKRKKEIKVSDPKEILRLLNQEVVYIESKELDITEDILERLQPKKKTSSTKSTRYYFIESAEN